MNVSFIMNDYDIFESETRTKIYNQLKKDIKATIINNISTFDKEELIEDIEIIFNKNELLITYNEEYTSHMRNPHISYIFSTAKSYKDEGKNKYYSDISVNMLSTYRNIYIEIINQLLQ